MHESAPRQSVARVTLTVIGLVLATLVVLAVGYAAQRVLVWMLIAAFLAVAFRPPVDWLERRVGWCPRWLATLVVFLVGTLAVAALVTAFVIPLARETGDLAARLPDLVRDTQAGRGPLAGVIARFHVREYLANHGEQIRQYVIGLGAPTLALVRGAATAVIGTVTVVVLTYVMVLEAPRITRAFLGLFPAGRAARIADVGQRCARTVTGYLTGNLLISLICGALTYAVLLILGVPYAALLAVFVAIMDLIPLVGATLGALVAVLVGFTESTTAGIVLIVFFVAYQQVEDHLLQPVIFSRTVQLSPLTVLVAILVAVELAGILGALLAIPFAGMIKVVCTEVWRQRRPAGDPAPGPAAGVPAAPGGDPAAPASS